MHSGLSSAGVVLASRLDSAGPLRASWLPVMRGAQEACTVFVVGWALCRHLSPRTPYQAKREGGAYSLVFSAVMCEI